MFTRVICMHARSIIFARHEKGVSFAFGFCDMERGDEFAFCTQQHDDGIDDCLVASFELSSSDAAFGCLFVQQQQVYKLILDRPLSMLLFRA